MTCGDHTHLTTFLTIEHIKLLVSVVFGWIHVPTGVDAFTLCWSGENSWILSPPTWYRGDWNTWSRVWRWEHWLSHCGLQLRCYKTDWVQIPPYEDMFLPVTPSASFLSGIPCYRVLALWSRNYFGSHGNNTRHKSLKQEPFVLNFLQISYIHSSHLCSHSNVPLSFPNVEPSIFLEHWNDCKPKSTLGRGKSHKCFKIVTRIVGSINVSQIQFVRVSVKCVIVCYWPGAMSLRGQWVAESVAACVRANLFGPVRGLCHGQTWPI